MIAEVISEGSAVDLGLVITVGGAVIALVTQGVAHRSKVSYLSTQVEAQAGEIAVLEGRVKTLEEWKIARENQAIGRQQARARLESDKHRRVPPMDPTVTDTWSGPIDSR